MSMPLNSFVLNSHWYYPAVQHLTASAGGGGKSIPSSLEKSGCAVQLYML